MHQILPEAPILPDNVAAEAGAAGGARSRPPGRLRGREMPRQAPEALRDERAAEGITAAAERTATRTATNGCGNLPKGQGPTSYPARSELLSELDYRLDGQPAGVSHSVHGSGVARILHF